ncbi:MAG: fibrobacter succinogenes major paralogous domain-containing protein [Fibromonadaceae bacterium]|jgi:uncharacterized protein (TIGR02145 family)|nr:fibrobacter succinogenes major paralogous domain-containing protein [Fibromonadaceae bacterium]
MKVSTLTAALALAMALTFSCTSNIEMPPHPDDFVGTGGSSSSDGSSESQGGQIEGNVFTDFRDGNRYKFEAAPNGSIWMSENLNYSRGGTIGYCYGVDIDGTNPHRDSTSCDNGYGRVYDWTTAMDGNNSQGLCPIGWHIPSVMEWGMIENVLSYGTRKMSTDFYIYPGNYNLQPQYPPLGWKERGMSGFYWTSSGNNYYSGFWNGDYCKMYGECFVEIQTTATASERFSVRCVKDSSPGNNSSSSVGLSSSSTWSPPASSPLTLNTWSKGTITSSSSEAWYSFNVIAGTTYYVWLDDIDTEYSLTTNFDGKFAAYYSNGTLIFDDDNYDYDTNGYKSFIATSSGIVYVKVYPYDDDYYYNTDAFSVGYTTSSTKPSN